MEEATRMCRDKMIRLRSLYITQFKRLQHVLRERRRKYCQAIQAEEIEETGYQTTAHSVFLRSSKCHTSLLNLKVTSILSGVLFVE